VWARPELLCQTGDQKEVTAGNPSPVAQHLPREAAALTGAAGVSARRVLSTGRALGKASGRLANPPRRPILPGMKWKRQRNRQRCDVPPPKLDTAPLPGVRSPYQD